MVFWISSEEITVQVLMKHRNEGFWVLRQMEYSAMRAEDHAPAGDGGSRAASSISQFRLCPIIALVHPSLSEAFYSASVEICLLPAESCF